MKVYSELFTAQAENRTSDPTPGIPGRFYWDTNLNLLKVDTSAAIKIMVDTNSTQTLTGKTIAGASNTLTVRLASDVTGTLPIGNGGTGQITAILAYDALAAGVTGTPTKGDLLAYDTTSTVRLPAGANNTVLTADSTQTSGLKWATAATVPAAVSNIYSNGTTLKTLTNTMTESLTIPSGETFLYPQLNTTGFTMTVNSGATLWAPGGIFGSGSLAGAGTVVDNLFSDSEKVVTTFAQTWTGPKTFASDTTIGTINGTSTMTVNGTLHTYTTGTVNSNLVVVVNSAGSTTKSAYHEYQLGSGALGSGGKPFVARVGITSGTSPFSPFNTGTLVITGSQQNDTDAAIGFSGDLGTTKHGQMLRTGSWTLGDTGAIGGSTFAGSNIVGRTNQSTATTAVAAGYVGEYIERTVTSATSLTSNTTSEADTTGITLTPGVYDISGVAHFVPGATTTVTVMQSWIGTATGNSTTGRDVDRNFAALAYPSGSVLVQDINMTVPVWRIAITSSTTYYLKALSVFGTSTMGFRGTIRAIRVG